MKIIGLIKEYDNKITSKSYNEYKKNCLYTNKEEILNYLNKGISIAATMNVVKSLAINDNSIIGGINYMTDGYWIWPNYIVYYFKKESIELPTEFIEYILNKKLPCINEINKDEAIDFLKRNI
jgi:hypothetical protein